MAGSSASLSLPDSLENVRIEALPPAAYYIADFITEEEEAAILHKVGCPTKSSAAATLPISNPTDLDGAETEMEAADAPTPPNVAFGPRPG